MALNLEYEFRYSEKPFIPIRLTSGQAWVDTEAMLDTGADVSLLDAALAGPLNVYFHPRDTFRVVGVAGAATPLPRQALA